MDIKDISLGSTGGSRNEGSSDSDYENPRNLSPHIAWLRSREASKAGLERISDLTTEVAELDAVLRLYRDVVVSPAQALEARVGDLLDGRGWTDELVINARDLLRDNVPATGLIYRHPVNNGTTAASAGNDADELLPSSPGDVLSSLIFQRRYYLPLPVAVLRELQAFVEEIKEIHT